MSAAEVEYLDCDSVEVAVETAPAVQRAKPVPMFGNRPVCSTYRHASEVAIEAIEEVLLMNEFPDALAMKTGIRIFDDAAAAALQPGRLIVVAGESGGAKTALLAQWALAFSAQVPTMLVTLEDDERDLIKRSIASISRQNVGLIRTGFPGAEVPNSVLDTVGHLAALNLYYSDDMGSPTAEQLAIQMMVWRRENPDAPHAVVLIDQLSHIRPSNPNDPFWNGYPDHPKPPSPNAPKTEVLEWQVELLRESAKKNRLTVVLAHQLNDNVSSTQKPTRQSVRDSRGIVHKADLVMAPWIPPMIEDPWAAQGQPSMVPNTHRYGYMCGFKARTVPEFELKVQFIGAQQRFIDIGDNTAQRWTAEAAPTARQLEGGRRLAELNAQFALAALQRQAAARQPALPSGDPGPAEPGEEVT